MAFSPAALSSTVCSSADFSVEWCHEQSCSALQIGDRSKYVGQSSGLITTVQVMILFIFPNWCTTYLLDLCLRWIWSADLAIVSGLDQVEPVDRIWPLGKGTWSSIECLDYAGSLLAILSGQNHLMLRLIAKNGLPKDGIEMLALDSDLTLRPVRYVMTVFLLFKVAVVVFV